MSHSSRPATNGSLNVLASEVGMFRRVRSSDRRFPSTPASGCGTTAMLALESAQRACDSAGVSPRDISLLILCKATPDESVPTTSSAVAGALGIGRGAMDLNLCRVYVRTGHGSGPYLGGSWKSLGYRRGNFDANHELGGPYQRVPFRRRSGGRRARASRRPRIPAWLEPRSRWVSVSCSTAITGRESSQSEDHGRGGRASGRSH